MSYRIDVSKIDGPSMDVNGFMTARAKLTRTGVFPYLMFDGSISYELRHPDDVFDPESLKSAQSQVITNDHPPMMVYSDNAKEYCVGFTSEKVDVTENKYIESSIKVTDEKTISDVMQGGKNQFSEGYRCDVIQETGMYEGQSYNARQKNIRYNHAAIVWEGRAGPDVSIKMDGIEKDFGVMKIDSKNSSCKQDRLKVQLNSEKTLEEKIMSAKIKIDKMEFEVTEALAPVVQAKLDALENTSKELIVAKEEASKAQGKADALNSDIQKRDAKIAELEGMLTDDAIMARADSLIQIKEFAKEVLGEDKKDSISNLKKAVVSKLTGIDCEKKDSSYIDTAFETLKASYKTPEKKDALKEVIENGGEPKADSVDAKIKAHMDALGNRWKTVQKK